MNGYPTYCPETYPALSDSFQHAMNSGIRGDYYEFGLAAGGTLWHSFVEANKRGFSDMKFWGFDSFQGLPETVGIDANGGFNKGDYAYSYETVMGNLSASGIDWNRTRLIQGFYDESLKPELVENHGMKKAAVVLVDCDLYSSTVPVLKFIAPLIQNGTVILFDDYNCFKADDNKGERLAFREFLKQNRQWYIEPFKSFGWHGQSFIMRETV